MDPTIIASIISLGGMGILFGGGLAFASKKLAVKIDPKVEKILEILPCYLVGFYLFQNILRKGELFAEDRS